MLFTQKIKQIITNFSRLGALSLLIYVILALPATALASPATPPASPGCNSSGCDLVAVYIQPTLDLLSGIVGIVVVISLILGGIEYSAAEGDPQKSSKAKNRIAKTIFALISYFFLYAFLQFLVPNGIFH